MVNWFGPKLARGERVLLRNTALRDPMLFVTTGAAGVGILLLFFGRHPDVPAMGGLRAVLVVIIPLGLYWATVVFVSRSVMAGWAITDRRVLAWRGLLRKEVEELRRDEIDRSNLSGDDLMVRGGGRCLRLNLKRVRDEAVRDALGDSAPPTGLKAESLSRILRQGEALAWRHSPLWMRVLPAAATWTAAVTDRRILLRRVHDFTRYDAIPPEAIEEIEAPHEGSHRVYLHANGQRYEFRPGSLRVAERFHEAIERAREVTR